MLNVTDLSERIKSYQKDTDQRFDSMERDVTRPMDTKVIENIFQSRLMEPMIDLENRLQQRIEHSAQTIQQKLGRSAEQDHALRMEILQGWKTEATNRFEEIESKVRRYQKDGTLFAQSLENYTTLEASILRCQSRLEQQESRVKETNQMLLSKLPENIADVKAELVQMLHSKLHTLSTRFEEELITIKGDENQNNTFKQEINNKMKSLERKIKNTETKAASGWQRNATSRRTRSVQQEVENSELKQHLMRIASQVEASRNAKEVLDERLIAREKAYKVKLMEFEKKFEIASVLATKEREEMIERLKQEARIAGIAKGEQRVYKEIMDNVTDSRDKLRADEKKARQELQHLTALLRKSEHDSIIELTNLRLSIRTKQNEALLLQHECDLSKKHVMMINKSNKKQNKKVEKQKMLLENELHFLKLKLSSQTQRSVHATRIGTLTDDTPKTTEGVCNGQEHFRCEQALQNLYIKNQQELQSLQIQYDELNDAYIQTKKKHEQEVTKTNASIYQEYAVALEELRNVLSIKENEMMKQVDTLLSRDKARDSQMEQLTNTIAMIQEENDTLMHKLKHPTLYKDDLEQDVHMFERTEVKKLIQAKEGELERAQNSLKMLASDLEVCREAYNLQSENYKRDTTKLELNLKNTHDKMLDQLDIEKNLLADKNRLEKDLVARNSQMETLGLRCEEDLQHLAEEFSSQKVLISDKLVRVETNLAESEQELGLLRDVHQKVCEQIQAQATTMSIDQTRMEHEMEKLYNTMQLEQEASRNRTEELEESILHLENEIAKLRVENEQAKCDLEAAANEKIGQQKSSDEVIGSLRHFDEKKPKAFDEKWPAKEKEWSELHNMARNELVSWRATAKCGNNTLYTLSTRISELQGCLKKSRENELDLQKLLTEVMRTVTSPTFDKAWSPPEFLSPDNASQMTSFIEHWTELESRFHVKNAEIDGLKVRLQNSHNEQQEFKSTVQALQKERNDMKDLLNEMRLKSQELEHEMQLLQKINADRNTHLSCLEKEKLALQTRIDELHDQAAIIATEIESKRVGHNEELKQAKCQYEELERAHEKSERTIKTAKEYLNRVENEKMIELNNLKLRVDVLEDEICATDTAECTVQENWNWQQIKSIYDHVDQRKSLIRTAFSKLSLSIGVTVWCQLRSLLHEQVNEELNFIKDRKTDAQQLDVLQEEEDNIFQTMEAVSLILNHLEKKRNASADYSSNGSEWLKSFSDTAPLLVRRLKNMEVACEMLFFGKDRNASNSSRHLLNNTITIDDNENDASLSPASGIGTILSDVEGHFEESVGAVDTNCTSYEDSLIQTDKGDHTTSQGDSSSDGQDEKVDGRAKISRSHNTQHKMRDDTRSWSPSNIRVEVNEPIHDTSRMSREKRGDDFVMENNSSNTYRHSISQFDETEYICEDDLNPGEGNGGQQMHSRSKDILMDDRRSTAPSMDVKEHGNAESAGISESSNDGNELDEDILDSSSGESELDIQPDDSDRVSLSEVTHVEFEEVANASDNEIVLTNTNSYVEENFVHSGAQELRVEEEGIYNDANQKNLESNDHDNVDAPAELTHAHGNMFDSGYVHHRHIEDCDTNENDVLCIEKTTNAARRNTDHDNDKETSFGERQVLNWDDQALLDGSSVAINQNENDEIYFDDNAVSGAVKSVDSGELSSFSNSSDEIDRFETADKWTGHQQRNEHEEDFIPLHSGHEKADMGERDKESINSFQIPIPGLPLTTTIADADENLPQADYYTMEDISETCGYLSDSDNVEKKIVALSTRLSESSGTDDSDGITHQQNDRHESTTHTFQKTENLSADGTIDNEAEEYSIGALSTSEDAYINGLISCGLSGTENFSLEESKDRYMPEVSNESTFCEVDADESLTTIEQSERMETHSSDKDDEILDRLEDSDQDDLVEENDTFDVDNETSSDDLVLPDLIDAYKEQHYTEIHDHTGIERNSHDPDELEKLSVDADMEQVKQLAEPYMEMISSARNENSTDLQNLTLQQLVEDNSEYETNCGPFAEMDTSGDDVNAAESDDDAIDVFETRGLDWSSVDDRFQHNMPGLEAPQARAYSIDQFDGSKLNEEISSSPSRSVDGEEYSDGSFDLEESLEEEELDT